jgi:ABC-type multidrug transport system fused ATPase/permease subunit
MRRNRRRAGENKDKAKWNWDSFRRSLTIFSYVLPYKWAFVLGMFFLSAGSVLFLFIMMIPGEVMNIISDEPQYGISLNQLFLALLVFLAAQAMFSYLRVRLFAYVSEKSMARLRQDLYEKLIILRIPFLENRRVGELTSRITNDVTQVQGVVSVTLAEFLRQIIILLGGIVIIFVTMPSLALTMLATFPVVVVLAMVFGRYIRKLMKERQDQLAKTNVVVEETMQSIQSVKAYTNEWFEVQRYAKNLKEAVRISLRAADMRGLFAAFIIFIMLGVLFFIMWRAALMVQAGTMNTGDFVNFVVFTGVIGGAIASLGSFFTEIVSAVGATERILDILQEPAELPLRQPAAEPVQRFEGYIRYRQVSFAYSTRPDVEVLKGIDLRIEPGQRVALVGPSGAGKSTIVQLLLQFYRVEHGLISVDHQFVQGYDLITYRRNIGLVPQEVLLFGGSIRENILYGNPNASGEEVADAARRANALEFIESFPDGLDTLVGERGVKLSGGQRQRIAIARAILKDPAILILDEATSSLDAESEKLVQDALNSLMEGRTSIIIVHRLATIRNVDRIFVLDEGQIVEQGTHEELSLMEDSLYNSLAKLQFEQPT